MAKFYVCNKCGTVYPGDYYDQWGRKYGHGLGPTPACEALDSNYNVPPVSSAMDPATFMHPVGVCKGNLIVQDLPQETPTAVTAIADPFMVQRAKIMIAKQKENSVVVKLHHDKLAA